jgi:hypothetical protein
LRPRPAASTATPAPVAPPPTTKISYSGVLANISTCCSLLGISVSQLAGLEAANNKGDFCYLFLTIFKFQKF